LEGRARCYPCRLFRALFIAAVLVIASTSGPEQLGFVRSAGATPGVPAQELAAALKAVRAERDPTRRLLLIDRALEDQSLRGSIVSALFVERALTYRELGDCHRAIEDFTSALAHSRSAYSMTLDKVECLITVDQLDEANRELDHYLLSKPGTAQAYVLKGTIYEKEGFFTRAEDEYTRALHFDSQSTSALEQRAGVLIRQGKPRRALDDLNALIKLSPHRTDILRTRARLHVKLNDHPAALADFGRIEALNPGDDQALREKALVFIKTNRADKALQALGAQPSTRSEDAESQVLRARAYMLLKEYEKVQRILQATLQEHPQYAPAFLYSGIVLYRTGDADGALARLNRALELDGKLVEAYKERGRVFLDLKEPVRASVDLTAAADLDPSDGEIYAMRAAASLARNLHDAATSDFSRALENLPGDPRILFDRAAAYALKEDFPAALQDLDEVIKNKPDAARAWGLRGVINANLGNQSRAREDLTKATVLNPRDSQGWNNLGYFLYRNGEFAAALEALNRALVVDPSHENARYNLGLVLAKQEQTGAGLEPKAAPRDPGSESSPGTQAARTHEKEAISRNPRGSGRNRQPGP
jgi:tetratricopeptide (TPR) repeat protein